MTNEAEYLYRVFEIIDGEEVERMVGTYDRRGTTIDYNRKKRIYTDLPTARTYKKRLAKEGREAKIYRYVRVPGEVQ